MSDTSSDATPISIPTPSQPGSFQKWTTMMFFTLLISFVVGIVILLTYFCYIFSIITFGDSTYLDMISSDPIEMKTAKKYAKWYLTLNIMIISIFLFQLTTSFISFKYQLDPFFSTIILLSVLTNVVLSIIYYFTADEPVRTLPFLTFWVSLMICVPSNG